MGKETVEIVPAILSKERADFEGKLLACAPFVKTIQIDIMDGKFVPNATLAPEDSPAMPKGILMEYHLMVEDPLGYVRRIGEKGAIYELHLERRKEVDGAISEVKRMGGRVALAVSPGTPAEKLAPYLKKIEHALVMTVHPGFSGQKYLPEMEGKMRWLSSRGARVEVDGGIGPGSAASSVRAGARMLDVASAIFSKPDVGKAIGEIWEEAERALGQERKD